LSEISGLFGRPAIYKFDATSQFNDFNNLDPVRNETIGLIVTWHRVNSWNHSGIFTWWQNGTETRHRWTGIDAMHGIDGNAV